MSSIAVAAIVFGCTFGGALIGIFIRVRLPDHHRDADSKDVLKLVMGLIATVAALVLGLLISSAKSSYDTQEAEVQQTGIHLLQLDRILARFGHDATEARGQLRRIVLCDIGRTWPNDGVGAATCEPLQSQREAEELFEWIASLSPKTDAQRLDQSRALQLLVSLWETQRLLDEQARGSLSWPFLLVLVFWLTVLFVGFGLFTRFNATVIAALLVGALSVAGAVFLILEMNRPYSGVMQISSAPIRNALTQMDR
jgi:Na+/H+ antiporter NhaC